MRTLAVRVSWRVITIPLCLLPSVATALDLAQQPFSVRTVHESDAVHALGQGPDGMLWFGSPVGLIRFDGERLTEIPLEPGVSGHRPKSGVRRLRPSRDGSIWVATGAGSLELTAEAGSRPRVFAPHGSAPALVQLWPHRPPGAPDRARAITAADGLPSPWVWALAEDPEGAMWVGTEEGLVRFSEAGSERFSTSDGLPASFVTALAFAGGRLYVGTSAGVAVRRQGRFEPLGIDEPVLALAVDRAGRLWAAAHDRLLRRDPDGRMQAFAVGRATALAVDHEDNLWVGGSLVHEPSREGATLSVFVGGQPVALSTPMAPYLLATDLLVDREGSVWVSLREGGVTQLSTPPIRNLGVEEGLSGRIAYSLLHARDGSTYVATNGGVSRWLRGAWTTWADGDALGSGPRDIEEGPPGTPAAGIWLASEGHLLRGGPEGWRHHALAGPPFNAGVGGSRSLVITAEGDVLLSRTHPPGLLRLPGGDLARAEVAVTEGWCPGSLNHGMQAADGAFWFVGDYGARGAGVARVEDGRARCFGPQDGLPEGQFGAITQDQEGTIWIGTGWGRGVVRYRGGRFSRVPASAGLPPSSITGLLDDGRGFLWMCSESGVWRVSSADLHRCAEGDCRGMRVEVFGKEQGMRTPECTGAFHPNMGLDALGNVWVATLGGVSLFSPPQATPPVRPTIEEISVDGAPVLIAPTLTLASHQRGLVVRYSVASFLGPARPRLRHRLLGFDPDWAPVAVPGLAHYHGLGAGTYTLELLAGDDLAQVTRMTIVATPPFWRTWPFLVAMVALTMAVAFGLHRLRVNRISLRHRATNEERLRIARELHDGLAQKLRTIGLLIDRLPQDGGGVDEKLSRMRLIVSESHAELRRAITDMRHGSEQQRVEKLIEQVLSHLVVPTDVDVRLETSDASLPVPPQVAHEACLVAKEALVNALTHAAARRIDIGVLSDEEGLHLWVRDDGRGGLPSEQDATRSGHYGLLGMMERARQIGGVLSTRSAPGAGTEISFFVPRRRLGSSGGHP